MPIELLSQQTPPGLDFGSLGIGGAFGAGVMLTLHYVKKFRGNGKTNNEALQQLCRLIEQCAGRDERMIQSLNQLALTQKEVATLVNVLVQKTCRSGPVMEHRNELGKPDR